jgi:hypothetical protein
VTSQIRFRLRPDAARYEQYAVCMLRNDGRIFFEPRGKLPLPVISVQGIRPPLRTSPGAKQRARAVALVSGLLLAWSMLFIGLAQWLASHP